MLNIVENYYTKQLCEQFWMRIWMYFPIMCSKLIENKYKWICEQMQLIYQQVFSDEEFVILK